MKIKGLLIGALFCGALGHSVAQTINTLPSKSAGGRGFNLLGTTTEFAIPGGASAGVSTNGGGNTDAAGLLGFQVWQKDAYFTSVFFNYAGSPVVSGDQNTFGSFFLNPSSQGGSVLVSANVVFALKDKPVKIGGALRGGGTLTKWQALHNGGTVTNDGLVIFLVPSLQILTKTFDAGDNEYQLGLEAGPGFRALGGNLAQDDAFRKEDAVLGTDKAALLGAEFTFFARLNSIQPYFRFTYYGADKDVKGLTGLQGYMGVNILSAIFRG